MFESVFVYYVLICDLFHFTHCTYTTYVRRQVPAAGRPHTPMFPAMNPASKQAKDRRSVRLWGSARSAPWRVQRGQSKQQQRRRLSKFGLKSRGASSSGQGAMATALEATVYRDLAAEQKYGTARPRPQAGSLGLVRTCSICVHACYWRGSMAMRRRKRRGRPAAEANPLQLLQRGTISAVALACYCRAR